MATEGATRTVSADPVAAARALGPEIAASAAHSEANGRVSPGMLRSLQDAGLLRMFLPREVEGTEVAFPTIVEAIEEVARHDGSAGWITMIGSGTNFLLTSLPVDVVHDVFGADPDIATGGLLQSLGRAVRVEGGYRVSGRWPFGSGCEHCSWLIGGAKLFDGDEPVLDDEDRPVARMFLFPAEAVEIHSTWHVSGLRGTGSHDYEVRELFVPEAHAFGLTGDRSAFGFPHARMPLFGMLSLSLAAAILGMARGALDALIDQVRPRELASGPLRDRPLLQASVAQAEGLVRAARAFVHDEGKRAWSKAVSGAEASDVDDLTMRLAGSHAARACTEAVQIVFMAAGTAGIYETSPIQRFHRDVMAAQQHGLVAYYSYEHLGREWLSRRPEESRG